jgi:hypothetical protein
MSFLSILICKNQGFFFFFFFLLTSSHFDTSAFKPSQFCTSLLFFKICKTYFVFILFPIVASFLPYSSLKHPQP